MCEQYNNSSQGQSCYGISIRANNRAGRHYIPVGGVFDGTYPTSKTRRGRYQGEVCPTITAFGELYLLVQAEDEIPPIPLTDIRESTLSNG